MIGTIGNCVFPSLHTPSSITQIVKSPMIPMMQESNETALAPELKSISGARVKVSEPLARYTSIKVGGPADFFIEVENDAALTQVLNCSRSIPDRFLSPG